MQRDCESNEEITLKYHPGKESRLEVWFGTSKLGQYEIILQEESLLYLCVGLTYGSALEFLGSGEAPRNSVSMISSATNSTPSSFFFGGTPYP